MGAPKHLQNNSEKGFSGLREKIKAQVDKLSEEEVQQLYKQLFKEEPPKEINAMDYFDEIVSEHDELLKRLAK